MYKISVEELKTKFPKAIQSFREFIIPALTYNPEDGTYVKLEAEDEDAVVDVIISNTPRTLYDFFDAKKLYISIINDGELNRWRSDVNGSDFTEDSDSRAEAEQRAFYEAFKILNNG